MTAKTSTSAPDAMKKKSGGTLRDFHEEEKIEKAYDSQLMKRLWPFMRPHARFLAFRSPDAQRWYAELLGANCVTDVRGDVLRIGFGIYQDEDDVDRAADLIGKLR